MIRPTSLLAWRAQIESGRHYNVKQEVLAEFLTTWVEEVAGIRRGGTGLTDAELHARILEARAWTERAPVSRQAVSTARLAWCSCTGNRRDCEDVHQSGETHDGGTPLLKASTTTRPTEFEQPAIVWVATKTGREVFRKKYQGQPWAELPSLDEEAA